MNLTSLPSVRFVRSWKCWKFRTTPYKKKNESNIFEQLNLCWTPHSISYTIIRNNLFFMIWKAFRYILFLSYPRPKSTRHVTEITIPYSVSWSFMKVLTVNQPEFYSTQTVKYILYCSKVYILQSITFYALLVKLIYFHKVTLSSNDLDRDKNKWINKLNQIR